MDALSNGRRGVSEILAAVLMLALTIVGFALIAPLLVTNTQSQASTIITDLRNGQIEQGQSLTLVYQHSNLSTTDPPPYVNYGLLDYGSSPVLIKYVFLFAASQTYDLTEDSYLLANVSTGARTVSCSPTLPNCECSVVFPSCGCISTSPNCELTPQQVSVLQIYPDSAVRLAMEKSFELVLYSTNNQAFTFTGT